MATYFFSGGALVVAKVNTVTPANVNIGNTFNVTINAKTISFVATAATVANVTAGLAAAILASTISEFTELTPADITTALTLTAKTPGKSFTQTSSATGGTATLVTVATTANSGPNSVIAANFVNAATGATGLPGAADTLIFENLNIDLTEELDTLAAVTLAALEIRASYTGMIGRPRYAGAYDEYRPEYFQVGSTLLKIGHGDGNGSSRIKIDNLAVAVTGSVRHTATGIEPGIPAFLWKGTNAANTMQIARGSMGIAIFAGEAATLVDLNEGYRDSVDSDATVVCGSGVTFTGSTIDKSGGMLTLTCTVATITQTAGTTIMAGDGLNVTTANIQGGDFKYASNGTITNLNLGGEKTTAQVIFVGDDLRARTVTTMNVYGTDWAIVDEYRTVAWTNGIKLNRTSTGSKRLRLGENIQLNLTSL